METFLAILYLNRGNIKYISHYIHKVWFLEGKQKHSSDNDYKIVIIFDSS